MTRRAAAIEFESREVGRSHIAPEDLELLAEVTGLSEDDCIERLGEYRFEELAHEWRHAQPETPEEINRFYRETDLYLWELLAWNGSSAYKRYTRRLEHLALAWPPAQGARALDYGSGVGTAALQLARLGYAVTIADVPGRTHDFARARLARHGVPFDSIEIHDRTELPADHFDVVVCFDVLEHVSRPDAVAQRLVRSLKRGGGAAIIAAFDAQGEAWPHHLPDGAARFAAHRWRLYLQRLGLALVDDSVYRRVGRSAEVLHRLQYRLWRATGIYVAGLDR